VYKLGVYVVKGSLSVFPALKASLCWGSSVGSRTTQP